MTIINNIEELKKLSFKDKFYVIKDGDIYPYTFVSLHPLTDSMIVSIKGGKWSDAACFSSYDFPKNKEKVIITGDYDSKEVGQIMLNQYNECIAAVTEIYLQ